MASLLKNRVMAVFFFNLSPPIEYNIRRYIKLLAAASQGIKKMPSLKTVASNTIRIARLKLLFIAAKVVKDQNRDKVKYSMHDARAPAMIHFLNFLDQARLKPKPWEQAVC